MNLRPDSYRWNRAIRGAFQKGITAHQSGQPIGACPYGDVRKPDGRMSWSRSFIAAWREGGAGPPKGEPSDACFRSPTHLFAHVAGDYADAGETPIRNADATAALEALGGSASLDAIYREIEGVRPTANAHWTEKVRQTLQRVAVRVGPGARALAAQQ